MKRFLVILFIPLLFACEIPTAVELRGTPELRFSTNMNIGDKLAEQLQEDLSSHVNEEYKLASCANTSIFTYIVQKDLFEENIPIDEINYGSPDFDLPVLWVDSKIQLDGFADLLNGFAFHNYKSYLFISGADVVKKFSLGISVDGGVEKRIDITENKPSGHEKWGNEYIGTTVPTGGYLISLPSIFSENELIIKFNVYVKKGVTFTPSDFDDGTDIKVELVFWLPMDFIAIQDGAEIAFPMDFLSEEGDLFGREDPKENPEAKSVVADIIESLSMAIKFNTNPLLGKTLVIQNGNIEIKDEIKTNSLNIVFNKENMALINEPDNYPFAPTIKIVFDRGDTLKISKLFCITELTITAKIRSIIKFGDFLGKPDEPDETDESDEAGE